MVNAVGIKDIRTMYMNRILLKMGLLWRAVYGLIVFS